MDERMGTAEHKKDAPRQVSAAVITVSTTRALKDDSSGRWIRQQLVAAGHTVVAHQVVPDDRDRIAAALQSLMQQARPDAVLITGGTGITPKDVTIEAVRPLFEKELTAFGTLFSQLSLADIGSAALLSRATAGVIGTAVVFCMPGSLAACRLACTRLIFPELGHVVKHLRD